MIPQITAVVCTFNGERRVPCVLQALAAQSTLDQGLLEVVVVDNASTDDTARAAAASWQGPQDRLVVVREPKRGLSHARTRGFSEARAGIVGFIDDDNIPAPDWAQCALEVMKAHPRVGACGGLNEAELTTEAPPWFSRFSALYAVGSQGPAEGGDVTDSREFLWGAGLCVRRAAWEGLRTAGFSPMLLDRASDSASSGGDTELCLALRLAGWRLWYEPRLRLKHRIAEARLPWPSLCLLSRGDGASSIFLDPYHFALSGSTVGRRRQLGSSWWWRTLAALRNVTQQRLATITSLPSTRQGDSRVLAANWEWGRASALLRSRGAYAEGFERVAQLKARLDYSVPIPRSG